MKDYFKNLNTLTQNIKRKIYKNKDSKIYFNYSKMGRNCWKRILQKSNPLKIIKTKNLKVEVSNDILLDFTYSNQIYLNKIDDILGTKKV